jgi:hypothetical protein
MLLMFEHKNSGSLRYWYMQERKWHRASQCPGKPMPGQCRSRTSTCHRSLDPA